VRPKPEVDNCLRNQHIYLHHRKAEFNIFFLLLFIRNILSLFLATVTGYKQMLFLFLTTYSSKVDAVFPSIFSQKFRYFSSDSRERQAASFPGKYTIDQPCSKYRKCQVRLREIGWVLEPIRKR